MKTMLLHPRAASLSIAAMLVACAALALERGPAWTPAPLVEITTWLFGYEPALAARLVIAAEFALAGAVLASGTRAWNLLAAASVAFFSLACVSRGFRDGFAAMVPALLALGASLLLLWHARCATGAPQGGTARRGLSPGWSLLAGLVAAAATSNLTADIDFRTAREARAAAMQASTKQAPASIDLDLAKSVGKALTDSPLALYVRDIVDEIGTGDAYLVFYNPACETCHTVFREHFMAPRPELVFAIEIPLADGAVNAARGEPEPIECLNCQMRSLPAGPLWMIAPPMTVRVQGGVITCVADRFGGDCFNDPAP